MMYFPYVVTVAEKYARPELDSGELAVRSFTEVFKDIRKFDGSAYSFKNWIKKKVLEELVKPLRQMEEAAWKNWVHTTIPYDFNEQGLSYLSPDEVLTRLRQLPASTHTILVLATSDGYHLKEIIEWMDLPETVTDIPVLLVTAAEDFQQKMSDKLEKISLPVYERAPLWQKVKANLDAALPINEHNFGVDIKA